MAKLKILPKQREFLQSKKKTVAYIGSIGSGKSWIAGEKCVQLLLQGAYILVVAPNYKQLKNVLMMEIQEHLRHHGIKFTMNQSDMTIESGKGKIFGYSAEAVESIRGISVDALVMDEAAIIDRYVYEVSVGRIRRGKVPYQVFISTSPRGKDNWVFDLCQEETTHYIHQTIYDNYFLPKEYIEQLELEYGDEFARQELMGEFVDMSAGDSQLISKVDISNAQSRIVQLTDEPIIAALDVARFGKDSSVLVVRQGNQILYYKKWSNIPLTTLRDYVMDDVIAQYITVLVVDGVGVGAGLVDMLKESTTDTCNIVEFNGAYTSNIKYKNLRTESWFRMKEWIRSTGVLPTDEIVNDISTLDYFIGKDNKMALESKDALRSRGISSPDFGDALSMTFCDDAKKKDSKGLKKRLKLARGRYQG